VIRYPGFDSIEVRMVVAYLNVTPLGLLTVSNHNLIRVQTTRLTATLTRSTCVFVCGHVPL